MNKIFITRLFSYSALLLMALISNYAYAQVEDWKLDAKTSRLNFIFQQAGTDGDGEFTGFEADFKFNKNKLAESRFSVTIDMHQFATGDSDRDEILRGPDMFDLKKHPKAYFVTQQIRHVKGNAYDAKAELTLRGVTKPIRFPFTLDITSKEGKNYFRLKSSTSILRLAFGVGQGDWSDTQWIADEVIVKVDVTAVQQ